MDSLWLRLKKLFAAEDGHYFMEDTKRNRNDLVKLLDNVIELLSGKDVWIKYDLATTAHGRPVHPCHTAAEKFDLTGAIHRCLQDNPLHERYSHVFVWAAIARQLKTSSLPIWNDRFGRSQEDVITSLKRVRETFTKPPVEGKNL